MQEFTTFGAYRQVWYGSIVGLGKRALVYLSAGCCGLMAVYYSSAGVRNRVGAVFELIIFRKVFLPIDEKNQINKYYWEHSKKSY